MILSEKMKYIKLLGFLMLFIGYANILHAANVDSLLIKAESNYNQGLYELSIEQYEELVLQDLESPQLYYNLGNAYFKTNDIPSAILYYEKAKKLDPNDEDIAFNLQLANSQIIDKIEAVPVLFYIEWWKSLRNSLSIDGWAKLGIFTFILVLLLIAAFFLSRNILVRKLSFWGGITIFLIAVLSFTLSSQKHQQFISHDEAIVFTPTVTVKSSPNDNSVDLFVIHEGTLVEIRGEIEGWSEIKIANGSVGWVKQSTFRKI